MSDRHIHFFLGNDEFEIQRQVGRFESKFSDPTTAGMNIARLDARTVSENELANAINSMPFLADRRLVILQYVSKRYPGLDGHKKFLALLDTIPSFTRLVVVEVEAGKEKEMIKSWNWLIGWIEKKPEQAEYKMFLLPTAGAMSGWIVNETKRQGGSIESPAARRLAEMTGEDTRQASMEITKLLTYVNYAHSIGVEDVEAVSLVTASVSIFDMVDAVGTRKGKQAQYLFHRLLEEKDAFEIFPMVIRQFRLLIIVRSVLDDGGSLVDLKHYPGLESEFVAKKMMEQVRNFDMDTLKSIHHRLLAMDEATKTSAMPLETSLDIFIVETASR